MRYTFLILALTSCLALSCIVAAAAEDTGQLEQRFKQIDSDGNGSLSVAELVAGSSLARDVASRDLRLFDQDGDRALSFAEFQTLPTEVPPDQRVGLPDPVLLLVEQAVAAMDESFDGWDADPDRDIEVRRFINAFSTTLGRNTTRPQVNEADEDGNRRVNRGEARRFMEIQLGVRDANGRVLRESNGRVVNLEGFQRRDANRNGRLERDEYLHGLPADRRQKEFDKADADRHGVLSFADWSQSDQGTLDTINQFRRLDANLDAAVDPDELVAGTPAWQRSITSHVFPGFDIDQNGKLSLAEYRLTMHANPLLPWQRVIRDPNGDGQLSFAEFKFGDTLQFPLLRWIYFQRLDLDANEMLDADEFSFRAKLPNEFFALNADGTGWRSFYKFEGYPACGSPAVSPDGRLLAFDAWKINPRTATELFVMDVSGSVPQQVCTGAMPAWSREGDQLAFSRGGVRIIQLDGRNEQLFARQGWGAQWSPDGKQIAFSEGKEIKVFDVESNTLQTLLDSSSHEYNRFYWNMTWSPDSSSICFKGGKPDGAEEVVTLNVRDAEPQLKVHYSVYRYVVADFAWHPHDDRIVFGASCPERHCHQLYEFNPNNDEPPKLVVGQDPTRNNMGYCWTPDGKKLIVISGDF